MVTSAPVVLLTSSRQEALVVFEFRVTMYDPAHRDASGAYTRDDWTAVSDVGSAFAGVVLTEVEYQRVEDA